MQTNLDGQIDSVRYLATASYGLAGGQMFNQRTMARAGFDQKHPFTVSATQILEHINANQGPEAMRASIAHSCATSTLAEQADLTKNQRGMLILATLAQHLPENRVDILAKLLHPNLAVADDTHFEGQKHQSVPYSLTELAAHSTLKDHAKIKSCQRLNEQCHGHALIHDGLIMTQVLSQKGVSAKLAPVTQAAEKIGLNSRHSDAVIPEPKSTIENTLHAINAKLGSMVDSKFNLLNLVTAGKVLEARQAVDKDPELQRWAQQRNAPPSLQSLFGPSVNLG